MKFAFLVYTFVTFLNNLILRKVVKKSMGTKIESQGQGDSESAVK